MDQAIETLGEESRDAACKVAERFKDLQPDDQDACREFTRQLERIEQITQTAFRLSCVLARRAEGLEATAEVWRSMVKLCDNTLECLRSVASKFPGCCTPWSYDKVLDYRNAAQKRYELHV